MFSKERFLGVDFGTESIKAVELEIRGGRPFLTNYGEATLFQPHDLQDSLGHSFRQDMTIRFRALLEKMRPETKEICISMPSFLGLISLIDFPEMTETELEEAVRFEARKYIPSPLEEVSLSWEALKAKDPVETEVEKDPTDADKKVDKKEGHHVGADKESPDTKKEKVRTEVVLVAALNKDVEQYEGYVRDAGYDMKLLELETFSIPRAVVGNDPGTFLIIDIGARAANIILVEDGYVKKSRSIDTGGRDITRSLAESLNISQDRADALKKSGKDFLNAKDVAVIFPAIETIVNEAGRMIESWKQKRPDVKVDSVVLSGGTGRLTGLTQYLSKRLGVPTVLSNPWRMVSYSPALQPKIESVGASFSAAIGLALYGAAEMEKKKKKK